MKSGFSSGQTANSNLKIAHSTDVILFIFKDDIPHRYSGPYNVRLSQYIITVTYILYSEEKYMYAFDKIPIIQKWNCVVVSPFLKSVFLNHYYVLL